MCVEQSSSTLRLRVPASVREKQFGNSPKMLSQGEAGGVYTPRGFFWIKSIYFYPSSKREGSQQSRTSLLNPLVIPKPPVPQVKDTKPGTNTNFAFAEQSQKVFFFPFASWRWDSRPHWRGRTWSQQQLN